MTPFLLPHHPITSKLELDQDVLEFILPDQSPAGWAEDSGGGGGGGVEEIMAGFSVLCLA